MKKKRWIVIYATISVLTLALFIRVFLYYYNLKQAYQANKSFYNFENKNFWEFFKELKEFKSNINKSFKRQVKSMTVLDSYNRRFYVPGAKVDTQNFKLSSNSIGMLEREVSIEKPKGVYRILVLGCSRALSGFLYNSTFTQMLEEKLNNTFPKRKFEVINGGITGATVFNSFMNFALNWRKLEPDMIIIDQGLNDVSDHLTPFYLNNSQFYINSDIKPANYSGADREIPSKEGLDAFKTELEALILLAKGTGAKVALLNIQLAAGGDFPPRKRMEVATMLDRNFRLPAKDVIRVVKEHNDIMKDVARNHKVLLIDVSKALPKSDRFFLDAAHRTVEGNKIYTDVVVKKLLKSGFLSRD